MPQNHIPHPGDDTDDERELEYLADRDYRRRIAHIDPRNPISSDRIWRDEPPTSDPWGRPNAVYPTPMPTPMQTPMPTPMQTPMPTPMKPTQTLNPHATPFVPQSSPQSNLNPTAPAFVPQSHQPIPTPMPYNTIQYYNTPIRQPQQPGMYQPSPPPFSPIRQSQQPGMYQPSPPPFPPIRQPQQPGMYQPPQQPFQPTNRPQFSRPPFPPRGKYGQ